MGEFYFMIRCHWMMFLKKRQPLMPVISIAAVDVKTRESILGAEHDKART